jgi:hypothetical protein
VEDSFSLLGTEAPRCTGPSAVGDGGGAPEWGERRAAQCGEVETARGGVGNFVFLMREAGEAGRGMLCPTGQTPVSKRFG